MDHKPYILPQPQRCEQNNDITFPLYLCDGILTGSNIPNRALALHHARLLGASVREMTGLDLPIIHQGACDSPLYKILLLTDHSLAKDTYELSVTAAQITISGAGEKELLWGIQTLRQLISQEGALLHGIFIHDYPKIHHRGFYHDATRGRVPDLAALKRLADRCSYYKINELQFYVEHTYLFNGSSEIWRDETPLTAEEIMEFDLYCQNLGIDLIPSISTFGHLYKMLGSRSFSSLCELEDSQGQPFSFGNRMAHHTLNAEDPRALALMKARIDEYMSLFSSKYFNICADETFDIGLGKTKEIVERLGREEVYIRFVNELCHHVASRGKIPMFWGDIIVSAPEKMAVLPKDTICLNWGYAPAQDDSAVKAFHSVGARQYLCPGTQGWNSLINVMPDAYENISRMCSYAHQYGADGVLNTDWGDMGHANHPDFSAFGLILGAAFSWNSHILPFDEICRQVSVVEYGDHSQQIMDCISRISTSVIMNWKTAVLYKENCQKLLQGSDVTHYSQILYKEMIDGLSPEKYSQVNAALDARIRQLAAFLIQVPAHAKYPINCFINAAKGQRILNTIAFHLWQQEKGCFAPQPPHKNTEVQSGVDAPAPIAAQNTVGALDAVDAAGTPVAPAPGDTPFPGETAAQLETWFMSYKDIWRKQGKEAELYRLQEVINWYGDLLREMESNKG